MKTDRESPSARTDCPRPKLCDLQKGEFVLSLFPFVSLRVHSWYPTASFQQKGKRLATVARKKFHSLMSVFLNGKIVPDDQAVVSVFDRSFLYGDGLFETIRICKGEPFRWEQHLERFVH